MLMRSLALFLICFTVSTFLHCQHFPRKYRYWSIGGNLNAMNYLGELDPAPGIFGPSVRFTRPDFGLCLMKRIRPRISWRVNVSRGTIEGSDALNASYSPKDIHRKIRNLSFRNTIWEVKADLVIDLFENRGKPVHRADYTPYFFAGIVYFHHRPQAQAPAAFGGGWTDLQPMRLEGRSYALNQFAIPAGIGFRYKLDQRWDLAVETGWRFTFTDYLDDVSGNYQGRAYYGNDALAAAMADRSVEGLNGDPHLQQWVNENQGYGDDSGYPTVRGYGSKGSQRGDSRRKDWYIVTGFHITYILFPKVTRCPHPQFRE